MYSSRSSSFFFFHFFFQFSTISSNQRLNRAEKLPSVTFTDVSTTTAVIATTTLTITIQEKKLRGLVKQSLVSPT